MASACAPARRAPIVLRTNMALPAWLAVRFAKDAKNSSGRRTLAQPPIVEGQDHAPSHGSPSSSKAADELKALMARVRNLAPLLCTLSPEELSADENDLVDLAARLDPSADSPAQPPRLGPPFPKRVGRSTDGDADSDADGDAVDSLEGGVEEEKGHALAEAGVPPPKRQWPLLPREVQPRGRASRKLLVTRSRSRSPKPNPRAEKPDSNPERPAPNPCPGERPDDAERHGPGLRP